MSEQKIGAIIDGLGVTLDLDDGDLMASTLVIGKVVGEDGQVSLFMGASEGLSWIDQMGLLAAAHQVSRQTALGQEED